MVEETKKKRSMTRRFFMIAGGVVGGGLVVGAGAGAYFVNKNFDKFTGMGMGNGDMINAWVSINSDNTVTIATPRAEMGQGVYTSIPQLIAEELEVDLSTVNVIHPQPEPAYANTMLMTNKPRDVSSGMSFMEKAFAVIGVVGTGGSTAIQDGYDYMRLAGAQAREMLKTAAAEKWGIDVGDVSAAKGMLVNNKNGEKMTYGSVANAAKSMKLSDQPTLKPQKDFKLIGKGVQRLDIPEKIAGQAQFGIDTRLDNMLYAVVRHPSYLKGKITSIKNQSEVEAMKGVKQVVTIPQGIAVVADNTWRAKNAALSLDLEETDGGNGSLSSEDVSNMLNDIASNSAESVQETHGGDAKAIVADATKTVTAHYEVPYLAHATMEPLNCTALVSGDKAEFWVGHQSPSVMQMKVNEAIGTAKENIICNITYLGGAFGRRSESDFVVAAAQIANQMQGTPVQLVYTREEDMRNDMYRPAAASHFEAALSTDGSIEAWKNDIGLQSAAFSAMSRIMPLMAPSPGDDESNVEGAAHLPYDMGARLVSTGQADLPFEVGFWRSVGSSQNAFFTECFIDELAAAAGQDPYQFRANKLGSKPRFKAVLDKVAEMSNWSTPLPEGKFRGIALAKSFGSIVGQVAEISKTGDNQFKIDRFYCAIDCGRIVNPDTIEAQMQGSIIFGLSAALYGQITIDDGMIQEGNFPQYDMVRMQTSPMIDVHIMEVDEYPGGVGEPGTPPAAPALVNALAAATGQRVRSLPLSNHGYRFV